MTSSNSPIVRNKKKIAIVNIFYPPKALGGATRIVTDEVSYLLKKYGDEYEIVVFTANTESSDHYKLTVYPIDGYRVYSVSIALTASTNWHEKDAHMYSIFSEFLKFECPDIIHFHCIQAMTGSIVEAAIDLKVPYGVTLHDAWWISDHQFLVDQFGGVYPNGHPDPFAKIVLRDGVSLERSLIRRDYLKGLLNKANTVLTVSDCFREIYKNNGVSNAVTNKNGISESLVWSRKKTSSTNKVVCAHIGGMSAHKGFNLFFDGVTAFKGQNIEVLVVDHEKDASYRLETKWGNTSVVIVGRIEHYKIVNLYEQIDVLFAPSTCAESYGLVSREALACGCWVVASDIGAIGEDINSNNGFKISPSKNNLLNVLNKINSAPAKYKGYSVTSDIRYSSTQTDELVNIFRGILIN